MHHAVASPHAHDLHQRLRRPDRFVEDDRDLGMGPDEGSALEIGIGQRLLDREIVETGEPPQHRHRPFRAQPALIGIGIDIDIWGTTSSAALSFASSDSRLSRSQPFASTTSPTLIFSPLKPCFDEFVARGRHGFRRLVIEIGQQLEFGSISAAEQSMDRHAQGLAARS